MTNTELLLKTSNPLENQPVYKLSLLNSKQLVWLWCLADKTKQNKTKTRLIRDLGSDLACSL